MANVFLDKEKFLSLIPQFSNDVPYEIRLLDALLSQLPENAREIWLREQYFKYAHTGPYYVLQHAVFKHDIHYCASINEVIDIVRNRNLEHPIEYWNNFNELTLYNIIKNKELLCGFEITVKENNYVR